MDFTVQGDLGPDATAWVTEFIDLPTPLEVRAPLAISEVHLGWGRGEEISVVGDLAVKGGPNLSMDVFVNPEELTIKNLVVQDESSHATFALRFKEREAHVHFEGNLDKTTLDGLLVKNDILTGWIRGDIHADILVDQPMESSIYGTLEGANLGHSLELKVPLKIDSFSLEAMDKKLDVESARLTWGDNNLDLQGDFRFSEDDFVFDLTVSADGIVWERIEEILKQMEEKKQTEEQKQLGSQGNEDLWALPIEGILRVRLECFEFKKLTWRPFYADISFEPEGVEIALVDANLCGINTLGAAKIAPQGVSLNVTPAAIGQDLALTIECLTGEDVRGVGSFDLKGTIAASGKPEELMQNLRGEFELVAQDGHIHRAETLARIFALLNLTEVFIRQDTDMGKQGLPYDSINVRADLKEGNLIIKEAILTGPSVEIAAHGRLQLVDEKIDLAVLVAPHRLVDRVVQVLPIVGRILGGTLIAYPVGVRGDLKNPNVIPLAPGAIGADLFGIMKRTVTLPVSMVDTLGSVGQQREGSPQDE